MSRLSLELNNGQAIHDSDADIWFKALQYAVDDNKFDLAEVFHEEGQSLVDMFVDVEKGIKENKRKNYCDACGHHKDLHHKTGNMIKMEWEDDPDTLHPEYICDGETDYDHSGHCDCNDLVVDRLENV